MTVNLAKLAYVYTIQLSNDTFLLPDYMLVLVGQA